MISPYSLVERQRSSKPSYAGSNPARGSNKYYGVLEFHHKDTDKKDFAISKARLTAFNENVKKELDKCLCLCANCHREEHARTKGIL